MKNESVVRCKEVVVTKQLTLSVFFFVADFNEDDGSNETAFFFFFVLEVVSFYIVQIREQRTESPCDVR